MYSVVLMMALSGGAEAPDFGGRGCRGCNGGCSGVVASGCHGGHGCHGGGLFGGRRHGCHGGHGCNGCGGFVAACNGGCNGCGGGLFSRLRSRKSCGCCGTVVATSCAGCGGVVIPNTNPNTEPKTMPKSNPTTEPKKTMGNAPATIIVSLPTDAKLTFDGAATNSTAARRTFTTPALDLNSDYVYTLRAEVVRDGRTVVETQNVTVRGGLVTEVPFNFSSQGVASR